MACGDSLIHLLRTTDGRTPDNPCGLFCWEGDEYAWVQVVDRIALKVEAEWANLEATARRAGNQTELERLRPQTSAFIEDAKSLPNWAGVMFGGTLPGGFDDKIQGYIMIGRDGLCVLETLSAAVVSLGGAGQVNQPGSSPGGAWAPVLAGALALGAIGFIAYQTTTKEPA